MRRIRYSVAMSLDGYIAGPNGDSDWITMDLEIDFAALMNSFDTVLMGRRTFEAAHSGGGGSAMPGMTSVVVSRTLRQENHPGITILGENVEASLNDLRRRAGKDIWLFGGGSLFRSLLDLRLVDQIEVAVIPVLLGAGLPLLPPKTTRTSLKLLNSRAYKSGIVSLDYGINA